MTLRCLQLFIQPTNLAQVTIMRFNCIFREEKQWVQHSWLRPGRIRPNVWLTSAQRRGGCPGALQPPRKKKKKKEIMTLWYRTCCCSEVSVGQTPISPHRSPLSAPPAHTVHLILRMLQSSAAFAAPSVSSQPPHLFLETCSFTLFSLLPLAHVFEQQPEKAIWLQINAG